MAIYGPAPGFNGRSLRVWCPGSTYLQRSGGDCVDREILPQMYTVRKVKWGHGDRCCVQDAVICSGVNWGSWDSNIVPQKYILTVTWREAMLTDRIKPKMYSLSAEWWQRTEIGLCPWCSYWQQIEGGGGGEGGDSGIVPQIYFITNKQTKSGVRQLSQTGLSLKCYLQLFLLHEPEATFSWLLFRSTCWRIPRWHCCHDLSSFYHGSLEEKIIWPRR